MNASRTGYDYKLGSQVSYNCHHGYTTVGGDTITCVLGHDGKPVWDKPLPSCKGERNNIYKIWWISPFYYLVTVLKIKKDMSTCLSVQLLGSVHLSYDVISSNNVFRNNKLSKQKRHILKVWCLLVHPVHAPGGTWCQLSAATCGGWGICIRWYTTSGGRSGHLWWLIGFCWCYIRSFVSSVVDFLLGTIWREATWRCVEWTVRHRPCRTSLTVPAVWQKKTISRLATIVTTYSRET